MSIDSKQELAKQIRDVAQLKGSFTLRSGMVSDTYFDKYLFESNPTLLAKICQAMAKQIPAETEVLAGLEMGGIPVVTMLSHFTNLPAAFIRKSAKEYGTCKYAEGASLAGKRVTLIEDVVSSGGAIIDALAMLEADGVQPISIFCVIDRQTGGFENLQAKGYRLDSLLTMEDIKRA